MLDIIEYMKSEPLQKVVAAIDAGAVFPAGASAPVPADVQLLMTVEINPWAENEADRRRHEHIQLVDVELTLPPLRERRADIRLLAEHFANRQREYDGRPPVTLTTAAMELLEDCLWGMNILELKAAVQGAAILCPGSEIGLEFLPRTLARGTPEKKT